MKSALYASAAATAALLLSTTTGHAQEATPQATPPEIEASGGGAEVSFNVAVTSDYVFRGLSQTDESLAVQGGVDVVGGALYAGAWASNVDFGDDTDAELDLYAGVRPEAAGWSFDFGVIYYAYLGQPDDADWNFVEAKAAASRGFGPVTLGAALFYSPEFTGKTGQAVYAELNAAAELTPRLTVTGAVGNQSADEVDDYTTWNLGALFAATDVISVDLRYWGTDIDDLPIADDRVAVTLKATF